MAGSLGGRMAGWPDGWLDRRADLGSRDERESPPGSAAPIAWRECCSGRVAAGLEEALDKVIRDSHELRETEVIGWQLNVVSRPTLGRTTWLTGYSRDSSGGGIC